MSNVTFLPWVTPEDDSTPVSQTKGPSDPPGGLFGGTTARVRFIEAVEDESVEDEPVHVGALPLSSAGDEEPENAFNADKVEATLLRKLHAHDMTIREAEIWLNEQFASREEIADWVEKFTRLGYLNDERLAVELATRLSERKGQSRSIISRELRRRGVDNAAAEAALDGLDSGAEENQAAELALTRVRQFSRLDDATAERRLVGFLSRRGYTGQVVREATKAAMATRSPSGRGGVSFR
jgi:regulatory protein